MMVRASALGMGVGKFSRPWRGVGVITIPEAGMDTMQHIEVPPDTGVLHLLVPGVLVAVFIDHRCVADRVEVTY
jgi:hypothetical protein